MACCYVENSASGDHAIGTRWFQMVDHLATDRPSGQERFRRSSTGRDQSLSQRDCRSRGPVPRPLHFRMATVLVEEFLFGGKSCDC